MEGTTSTDEKYGNEHESELDEEEENLEEKDNATMSFVDSYLTRMEKKQNLRKVWVQADCLENLAIEAAKPKSLNNRRISTVNGHKHVIRAMALHRDNERVQVLGCGCLWAFSEYAELTEKMVHSGAFTSIVYAMQSYKSSDLHHQACGALRNLCIKPAHKYLACDAGVTDAVCDSMRLHIENERNQVYCTGTLMCLSFVEEHKDDISQRGGIQLMVEAMHRHSQAPLIQLHACVTFKNLSNGNMHNKVLIAKRGGLETIIDSIRNFPLKKDNQRFAMAAVRSLTAHNDENKVQVVRKGAVRVIIKAMIRYLADAELQQEACGVLRNLSSSVEAKEALADGTALDGVLKIMKFHASNPVIQEQACVFLFNIAKGKRAHKIIDKRGVESAVTALEKHIDQASLVEEACGLLWKLAGPFSQMFPGGQNTRVSGYHVISLGKQVVAIHKGKDKAAVQKYGEGMVRAWSAITKRQHKPKQPKTPLANKDESAAD